MFEFLERLRGQVFGLQIDMMITISQFQTERDVHQAYLSRPKYKTIHSGVDLERYSPQSLEEQKGPSTRIAFAGQLTLAKGVLTLLQAFKELLEAGIRNTELFVAGTGPQEEQLKDYCRQHKLAQVHFLGSIDSVPELFRTADVVVVPSEWEESFGLVVVEAMACGTAVICSDAGGIPEVLGDSGEAGLIFRRGDISELKQKIRQLIASPETRQQMGRRGRARAEQCFSVQKMVDGYVSVFDALGTRA